MNLNLRNALAIAMFLLSVPTIILGQAPPLGSASSFAVFTAVGAFNNDGLTNVVGDIGTNVGAFAGFPPGIVAGTIHVADPVSAQAATDVESAFSSFGTISCDLVIGTTLGNNQVLGPAVYCLGAASSLNGDLILDGQCDPNALFIFKIDGALSTNSFSNVVLTNNASACNIYWQINGAVALGEFSTFKGTIVANGAISLLEGAMLDGRALSRSGAIEMHNNTVNIFTQPSASNIIANGPTDFCEGGSVVLSGNCGGVWNTGETTPTITVTTSGDYFVINSNDCGTAISVHIFITVNPSPVCTISGTSTICEGQTTQLCAAVGGAGYLWSTGAVTNCITVGTAGTYSVTVTGANGCTSTCSQVVSVTPTPVCLITGADIPCAGQSSELCVPAGADSYLWSTGETTNCITVFTAGTYSVTVTSAGNCTNICSITIAVDIDVTPPAIICPADLTLECDLSTQPSNTGTATAADACDLNPTIDFTDIIGNGNCPQSYTITRIWTATDGAGNSSSCVQTITVTDNTPPVIVCPANLSNDCNASTLPANTGTATATDNCSASSMVTFSDVTTPGNCPQAFTITRTWTATDACGNSSNCIQTIIVLDNTPPTITCPANATVQCASLVPLVNVGLVVATDNCGGGAITVIHLGDAITNQTCANRYTLTRTYQAADACGNTATCTQLITVFDASIPTITCPANATVQCASLVPIVNVGLVVATDNCGVGGTTVSHLGDVITNQTCANRYTLTRTYQAADACGNVATCVQLITVFDATIPTIICPANATVACDNLVPIVNVGLVVATDNCGVGGTTVSHLGDVITNQTCANQYTLTRTYQAVDACDNTATCVQLITVFDATIPTITCPANATVQCASLVPIVNVGLVVATDNCGGGAITVSHLGDVITNQTCANRYTLTRTYQAADACGNTATCAQVITVFDSTLPIITCPANATVQCASLVPIVNVGLVVATDNCGGGAITVSHLGDVITNQTCANRYTLTRTYQAADACGNTAACTQVITVFDSTIPTITCPANATVQCASLVPIVNVGLVVATDNCGGGAITAIHLGDAITNQTCANRYTLTRTYQAADACGNTATCVQLITVFDATIPTITCPANATVQCASLVPIVNVGLVVATDNCGVGGTTVSHLGDVITNQTCANRYTLNRTYQAADACGNTATCVQLITVFDSTIPTITCPANATVQCASLVPIVNVGLVVATDNCGGGAITVSHLGDVITNQTCANRYTVTRTYQAADACGQTATCTQVITVFDSTLPVITCPANATVQCEGLVPIVNIGLVVATDNCGGTSTVSHLGDVITNQTCANRYTLTRTYQAADACGQTATCTQVITVFDSTLPVITCPANATVQCDGLVPPNIPLVVATDNCDGAVAVTYVGDAISNQTCLNQYVLTRTYRATDACGNIANCAQVITVNDNTPPTISFINPLIVPGSTINVQCYGQDPNWSLPVFDEGNITATDACGGAVAITFNETLEQEGNCYEDGFINLYRLTWTATDICGNSSNAFVFLALIDTIAPTIVGVPADITVNCNDIPTAPIIVEGVDECLCACIVTFEESVPIVGCQNGQVILRSWTAKDRCGNMTTQSQKITLIDNQGPDWFILLPEMAGITNDTTINYACNDGFPSYLDLLSEAFVLGDNSCGASFVLNFQVDTIISDNCDLTGFKQQRNYHWTGVDACGNTSSLTITARLIDNETPAIIGVPTEAICIGSPILNLVSSTDNCGPSSLLFSDAFVQNPCGTGMAVQRIYEAKDRCGNIARDTALLIPNDQNQPIMWFVNPLLSGMEVGEILTTECASYNGSYTNFSVDDVNVEDACTEGLSVVFTETLISIGDCSTGGNIATVLLKWTATDVCGNHSELSMTASIVDETSPVFVNFSPEITIGCNAAIPELLVTDNCGSVATSIWDTIIQGNCIFEYDMQRIVTAIDQCGNTSTATQTIHVGDGSGPAMSDIEEIVCNDLTLPIVTAFDACADTFVGVVMQEDTLDLPCSGLVIERTWTAIGLCGDTTIGHQIVILNDTIPPVISVPNNSIIHQFINTLYGYVFSSQTNQIYLLNALDSSSVFIVDDCDQFIIPVFTVEISYSDNCLADGYFERRKYTWVATDICGNSSTLTFTVDIMDDIPPVFVVIPHDTTIVCAPLPPVPAVFTTDAAQYVTIVYTEVIVPGVGVGVFMVTRTWTATDVCGNVTVYVQHIKWIPDTFLECNIILPPVVDCNTHGVMVTSTHTGGNGPFTYVWHIVGENCFIQGGQGTPNVKIYIGWTDVELILTITDALGCVSTCSVTVSCLFSLDLFDDSPITDAVNGSLNTLSTTLNGADEDLQELSLWPNPTSKDMNLSFESRAENEVELNIINLLGQGVMTDKIFAQKGLNTLKLDMSQMRDGTYLVQLKTAKEVHAKTVVIIHSN